MHVVKNLGVEVAAVAGVNLAMVVQTLPILLII
jgi:mannose/fructose-specific phosphotransferase system component IIA